MKALTDVLMTSVIDRIVIELEDDIVELSNENKALKELNEQYLNWLPASYYICNKDTNERS